MASRCVISPYRTNGQGYARRGGRDGKVAYAHRYAYEEVHGPIPAGVHLHHTCGVPNCVNVEHLEPVTPTEHRAIHGATV
jgi:hypothetical protein